MNTFVRGNIEFLRQAQRLIHELNDDRYQNSDLPPFNSSVGKHLRHVFDFYTAFLNRRDGRINYDERGRENAIETDRAVAAERIEQVCDALAQVENVDATVWSRNDEAIKTPVDQGFKRSTVGRELQFLASHTVHHFAVIAILLHAQGFQTPRNFGVAISTLAFWNQAPSS